MYSYNNIPQNNKNMYSNNSNCSYGYPVNQGDDRFAGGLLAPLFLGGVAGYAIGYNRPNNGGYYPYPQQPVPIYTNNYYYPYYY